jgi:hypothetical protein
MNNMEKVNAEYQLWKRPIKYLPNDKNQKEYVNAGRSNACQRYPKS